MSRTPGPTRLLTLAAALAVIAATPLAAHTQHDAPVVTQAKADSIRADSVLDARTTALAKELRCAVCQGISIQESPSALAQEMRGVVRDQLRAGRTPEEVKDYFVSKYGEWILLSPRAHGLNLVMLYLAPAFLLIGGVAFIAFVVRKWIAKPSTGETPAQ